MFGNFCRKITNEVTAAVEWSYWDFQTIAFPVASQPTREVKAPSGIAHVFNVSLAYQF